MDRAAQLVGGEGGAGLGGAGEDVVVGEDAGAEEAAEGVEGEQWEVVLGEGGDEGAPRGGAGPVGDFVEHLEGEEWEAAFGVEVDEVVGEESDVLYAGLDNVRVELLAFGEGSGGG